MSNTDLIRKFYESFARADAEGMTGCYAPDIVFSDPAFGELQGEDAKNMWRMLIAQSKGGLKITFDNVEADDSTGSAKYSANRWRSPGSALMSPLSIRKATSSACFNLRWGKEEYPPGYLLHRNLN